MVRHRQFVHRAPEIPHPDLPPMRYGFPGAKIAVANPVVELDGDEMTRIIWKKIREEVRVTFRVLSP